MGFYTVTCIPLTVIPYLIRVQWNIVDKLHRYKFANNTVVMVEYRTDQLRNIIN